MAIYSEFTKVLNYIANEAHTNAVNHGFYDEYLEREEYYAAHNMNTMLLANRRDFVLAQLAKIASEIGEAVSVIQHNPKMDGLEEELADIVIRTMDLAAFLNQAFGNAMVDKMNKNLERPRLHGKVC